MININYIKGLRAMKGKTQSEIAEILNLSLQSYNKKETGKVAFTTMEISTLSSYYEVAVSNFFNINVALEETN